MILLTPIFFQFAMYSRWMKPGMYTKQQVVAMPILVGVMFGSLFGVYECVSNPQRTYQTPVMKLKSSSNASKSNDGEGAKVK